jgi:TonB-dependent SusC/RagA subfamily outer membrane receptor
MTQRLFRAVLGGGLALSSLAGCHRRSSSTSQSPSAQNEQPEMRQFSGVQVTRMSSGGVRIRMISGINPNGPPLYVVDGAVVRVQAGGAITWLEIDEIESIDVLKGPAETAVYGPRGANGVIVIKTRMNR